MSESDIQNWINKFVESRNYVVFGSPLWAYKTTNDELLEIQGLLVTEFGDDANRTISHYIDFNLDLFFDYAFTKTLVLYLSTWIQRNQSAQHREWDDVLRSLHIQKSSISLKKLYQAITQGLENGWGLELFSTAEDRNMYLATLYCQGGFPRSAFLNESHSSVTTYFDKVFNQYASFSYKDNLKEIALDELSVLPKTLQQDTFAELAVSLIQFLIGLRDRYALDRSKNARDSIAYLRSHDPEWLSKMPFLVLDQEAEKLISRLLVKASSLVQRTQHPVRVKRALQNFDNKYFLITEIYINHKIHPEDLDRTFSNDSLPNHFDLITVRKNGKKKVANFTKRTGQSTHWSVNTNEAQRIIYDGIESTAEIKYEIWSDGKLIGQDFYYNGHALDNLAPWVFAFQEDLPLIGQGSVNTDKPTVLIVSDTSPKIVNQLSLVEEVGCLQGFSRRVYKVSGSVEIHSDFGSYVVKCSTNDHQVFNVGVAGGLVIGCSSDRPVYLGPPVLSLKINDELNINDSSIKFLWSPSGSERFFDYENHIAIGNGTLVCKDSSTVYWQQNCIILPAEFTYEVRKTSSSNVVIDLHSLKNVTVGMPVSEYRLTSEPSKIDGSLSCEIAGIGLTESEIPLEIYWGNDRKSQASLRFAIYLEGVALKNTDNQEYSEELHGELSLSDLDTHKLFIKTDQKEITMVGYLKNSYSKFPIASKSLTIPLAEDTDKHELNGYVVSGFSKGLMRHGEELTDKVELVFFAGRKQLTSSIPPIHKYKKHMKIGNDVIEFGLAKTITHMPSLNVSPTWDFSQAQKIHCQLKDLESLTLRYDLSEISHEGVWIAWLSEMDEVAPKFISWIKKSPGSESGISDFGAKLLQAMGDSNEPNNIDKLIEESSIYAAQNSLTRAVKDLRKNKSGYDYIDLDKSIQEISNNLSHEGWGYIDSVIELLDELPPQAFKVIQRLTHNNDALTLLLARETGDRFEKIWRLADFLPFEWHSLPIDCWVRSIQKAYRFKRQKYLDRGLDNDLAINLVDTGYESTLRAKGYFFEVLFQFSMNEEAFKKPTLIWPNENIQRESLKKNAIGTQFRDSVNRLRTSHQRLLDKVQVKKQDDKLLNAMEEAIPIAMLNSDLAEFLSYELRGHGYIHDKITIGLPVRLAFYLAGLSDMTLDKKVLHDLNIAISELLSFDRDWVNEAMGYAFNAAIVSKNKLH